MPDLAAGAACTGDNQCTSGVCGVNGSGNCCTAVCTTGGVCGATGCDSTGACQYPSNATLCGDPACSGNMLTPAPLCDSAGSCSAPGAPVACASNLMCASTTACATGCGTNDAAGDALCTTGLWCDGVSGGACQVPLGEGASCTRNSQCLGNNCYGGVCGPRPRIIFVSSTSTAPTGGVAAANALCQNLANAVPKLAGKTFKASIADSTSSPATSFTKDGSFVLMDGTQIATSWADLTDCTIAAPIGLTEKMTPYSNYTWTGTNCDGTVSVHNDTCTDWTGSGSGTIGQAAETDYRWAGLSMGGAGSAGNCGLLSLALYCVEQ